MTCETCGKDLEGRRGRRFCSLPCFGVTRRGDRPSRQSLDAYCEARIRRTEGCWEWDGPMSGNGYGLVCRNHTRRLAHRVAWERANGPIPDGLLICHHCDNRRCVRPDHLFLGTTSDNAQDMLAKGRGAHSVKPEAMRAGLRRRWDKPGAREEQSARSRAWWASRTPEERRENGRKSVERRILVAAHVANQLRVSSDYTGRELLASEVEE